MADQTTKKQKGRTAEILSVLARHNFYSAGFTPEELRTTLEDLGPFYVKLGQILSSRTDILPDSYCKELEKLRSNVRPLPASDARRVIEEETGKKIEDIYSEFRDEPLGSASIAQAHFGILKDGTKVVTKVQRPGVADMVRKDFALLKKLASVANIVQEGDDGESVVNGKVDIGSADITFGSDLLMQGIAASDMKSGNGMRLIAVYPFIDFLLTSARNISTSSGVT